MKHTIFFILLSLIILSNAQNKPNEDINTLNDSIVLNTTPLITTDQPKIIPTEPSILTETYINDDLAVLSDDEFAKYVDKLWFNELEKSPLNADDEILSDDDEVELTTDIIKERLAYLDSKTPFHVEYNEILEHLIKQFIKRKKSYSNYLTKSKYYFPMMEEQLAKYDIPLEMKYLSLVESRLNPLAKSPVGATGLWQFMYQTGLQFDLKVSSYVDERSDPLKATEAACKFLKALHDTFDDWDLALAAYNSGPGNVSKAIRRSGGSQNYWNLRPFLPIETANYVPLFYATMYFFEFANEHKIKAETDALRYYEVDSLRVQRQITFDQISQAIPIEKDVLKLLNPQYKLEIIPVIKGRDYTLVLPKSLIGDFVQNEDRIYAFAEADDAKREKPLPKYTEMNNRIRYKVKSGDYLGKIAKKFGVSVSKIKQWNNMKSSNLRAGQRLTIFTKRL